MLLQQHVNLRPVAQVGAVVAPPVVVEARLLEAGVDGGLAARFVAHQLEGEAEVHEAEAGVRLFAGFRQRAQRGQRCLALPRQHVGAVGEHTEAAGAGVAPVVPDAVLVVVERAARQAGNALLQPGEQEVDGLLLHFRRHRETLLARVEQEVGDVGREPVLVLVDVAPQAEAAVRRLHAGEPADGLVEHLGALRLRVGLEPELLGRGFVDEDVRVGSAGGLLGAAVGVGEQALHGALHVDRRLVGDRERGVDRLPEEAGEIRFLHLQRFAGVHGVALEHRLPRRRRLHLQREGAVQLHQRAFDLHLHFGEADGRAGFERDAQDALLLILEAHLLLAVPDDEAVAVADLDLHFLLGAGEVVHVERQERRVAHREEARRGELDDERRGDGDFGLLHAEALAAGGHRHQAQAAVEVRYRQADFGFAVGVERHRAAEQVDQAHLLRQALGRLGRGVATPLQLALLPGHAFDEAAVDVVEVVPVAQLGEEEAVRVGALEAGDIEDADIHCGERDHGRLPLRIGHLDLHLERLVGRHLLRRFHRHIQLAVAAFERQVGKAEGAGGGDAGAALFTRAAGAQHHGGDVEVVPLPLGGDRDVEDAAVGRQADAARPEQLVAFHRDQRFAGMRRGDCQLGGFAVGVGGLVEFEGNTVRAHALGFVVLGGPAGIEAEARDEPGFRVEHFDAVAAVLHRHQQLAAAAGGHGDLRGGDQFVGFVVAGMPAALVVEAPVPVAVLAEDAHRQRGAGLEVGGVVGNGDFELGVRAFARIGADEHRPQADQHRRRPVGALDAAHHRAAAAFEEAERGAHGEGRAALLHRRGVNLDAGLALVVERGFGEFGARAHGVFVGIAEDEAGQLLFQRVLVALGVHHAEQLVAGGGRAVEVVAGDVDLPATFGGQLFGLGGEVELHALGQEFLDVDAHHRAGHLGRRVGAQFEVPRAGGGVGRQFDGLAVIAGELLFRRPGCGPLRLAIRTAQQGLHGLGRHRAAVGIARHHRDIELLAGAVEVAAAVGEEAHRRRGKAADVELGKVERGFLEGDQRKLLALLRHHDLGILRPLGKVGAAVAIGFGAAEDLAVSPEPADLDAGDALAGGERADEGIGALAGVLPHMQAEVADVVIGGLVFVAEAVGLRHHRYVDAGLLERRDVFHGQEGDAAAVGFLLGDKAADEGAGGHPVDLVERPAVHRALQAGAAVVVVIIVVFALLARLPSLWRTGDHLFEELRQRLRLDLEELDIDLGHIDRADRQAATLRGRQHHALAGKVEGGGNGGGLHRETLFLAGQPGTTLRRHARQHAHDVAGARLDVGEEEQAGVLADRPGAGNRLAVIDFGVFGLAADAGAEGGVVVDAVLLVALVFVAAHARPLRTRQRRHFEHLHELADVGLGVERQAEGKGQCGGAIQLTVRGIDDFKGDTVGGERVGGTAAPLLHEEPPGGGCKDEDGDDQRHCANPPAAS